MNQTDKMKFPRMLRELRVSSGKKQREVADGSGLRESSYANAECNNHKTIRLERVLAIARFYGLGPDSTAELQAAWEELPASKWNQQNGTARARRQALRDKATAAEALRLGLLEMTTLLVTNVADPGQLCTCDRVDMFDDSSGQQACELCCALRLLGLPGWTNLDDVIIKLAAAQEGIVTG